MKSRHINTAAEQNETEQKQGAKYDQSPFIPRIIGNTNFEPT